MPCPACGFGSSDTLCAWHEPLRDDGWAMTNRVMCDALHRGRPLPRVPLDERDITEHRTQQIQRRPHGLAAEEE